MRYVKFLVDLLLWGERHLAWHAGVFAIFLYFYAAPGSFSTFIQNKFACSLKCNICLFQKNIFMIKIIVKGKKKPQNIDQKRGLPQWPGPHHKS